MQAIIKNEMGSHDDFGAHVVGLGEQERAPEGDHL